MGENRRGNAHNRHREEVFRKYAGNCHICGETAADAIDHYIPYAQGGSDHIDNLRCAHTSCNSRKGDKLPGDWAQTSESMWCDGYGPAAVKEARAKRQSEKRKAAEEARAREAVREVRAQEIRDDANNELQWLREQLASNAADPPIPKWTKLPYLGFLLLIPCGLAVVYFWFSSLDNDGRRILGVGIPVAIGWGIMTACGWGVERLEGPYRSVINGNSRERREIQQQISAKESVIRSANYLAADPHRNDQSGSQRGWGIRQRFIGRTQRNHSASDAPTASEFHFRCIMNCCQLVRGGIPCRTSKIFSILRRSRSNSRSVGIRRRLLASRRTTLSGDL